MDSDLFNEKSSICTINSSLPSYQPNVFVCPTGSNCCSNRGMIACCAKDVSFSQFVKQSVPLVILFCIIFGTAWFIRSFFDDDDVGKPVNQKSSTGAIEFIMPNESDLTVEDPVFGRLYKHQLPKLATKQNQSEAPEQQAHSSETF